MLAQQSRILPDINIADAALYIICDDIIVIIHFLTTKYWGNKDWHLVDDGSFIGNHV